MIEISGRTDVIAQWFSDEYIKEHGKVFEKVVVGQGEVLILIKDGKAVDTITESKVKNLGAGGLLSRLKDKISGTDTQIMMVSLLPFAVQVGFQGYTKDRTEIAGALNASVHISKDNLARMMNLFKRDLVTDAKWGIDRGKLKEVTREDVENIIEYDTSLTLDATIISQMESSEMRDDLSKLNARIKNAVDSMSAVWANCGLSVDVVKADVQKNLYEEVMRDRDNHSKAQMVMDTQFKDKAHELELQVDYGILYDKKDAERKMNKVADELKLKKFALDFGRKDESDSVDHEIELRRKKLDAGLENARTQADIDKVNGVSQDELERIKIATKDFEENLKIDREQRVLDADFRRKMELLKFNYESDKKKWFEDGKEEGKQIASKECYDRGFREGSEEGRKEGSQEKYDSGFNAGKAAGLELAYSIFANINGSKKSGSDKASD